MKYTAANFGFAILVALILANPLAASQALLDGRKFNTEAGYTDKPAHVKEDILSFQDGKFHSSDCDQYGYNRGDYRATTQAGPVAFEVETVSEQYGRNVWKGVVTGNTVEGTMVFYRKATFWRPHPEPLVHWFKGKAMP